MTTPGAFVRELRIKHRLSQRELAVRAGTTQSAIARIETERGSPSVKTVAGLLEAMGEELVLESRPVDWGVDVSLNRKNLGIDATARLERGLGFADEISELKGQLSERRTLERR